MGTSLRTKNQCEDYLKKIAVDTIVQYSLGDPSKSEVNWPRIERDEIALISSMLRLGDWRDDKCIEERDVHERHNEVFAVARARETRIDCRSA